MTHTNELRERVREVENLAMKHDGIPFGTFDCTFSKDNPWLPLLAAARRNLVAAVQADEKHGALVIKTLGKG
jgi:hypothetical protein